MQQPIKEFHLFAGLGGGIYGGRLLKHECCGAVEIDDFCKMVLETRQNDNWMERFPIYGDIRSLNGEDFKGTFDILCGGFPCQAFSHAAHGKNIKEKNLWEEMLRFVKESQAPIVFGENVTLEAISTASSDLEKEGYSVKMCRLSCADIGADHKRARFWLLAVKDKKTFLRVAEHLSTLPKFTARFWETNPQEITYPTEIKVQAPQKKGVGNAQAPMAAAVAFRVLANRHINAGEESIHASENEIENVFEKTPTWIRQQDPNDKIFVHTPTTMANYHCKYMMRHPSCVKYVKYFGKATAVHAEYLIGFPIGASSPNPLGPANYIKWIEESNV